MAAATLGHTATKQFGLIGRLLVVAFIFGITIWPIMARFERGQTLQIKEQQLWWRRVHRWDESPTDPAAYRAEPLQHRDRRRDLNMVGVITTEAVISLFGWAFSLLVPASA